MKYDTVVVGGGLFGKIISRALARQGQAVQCIDNHNTLRGSDPAACLMKPSWLSKLGKELGPCLELLDDLYGVTDIDFRMGPAHTKVHWVDPAYVLYPSGDVGVSHANGTVEGIGGDVDGKIAARWRDSENWEEQETMCDSIIVAGGIWSTQLVPSLRGRMDGRWGVAIRTPGQIEEPFIKPWAPFKQLVAFNIDDQHIWCGDGSAWKHYPTEERIYTSVTREVAAVNASTHEQMVGVRPYVKTPDPCLLEEFGPDMWVATGGAKNGTAAAAWAARRLIERLT